MPLSVRLESRNNTAYRTSLKQLIKTSDIVDRNNALSAML